jgi:asparagine N-glycosylation enzyme membrane subunit Stt3
MPIDLSAVNWIFVALMAVMAFIAALLGSVISLRNRFVGAVIAGILFAIFFVAWNYYPHPTVPLPIVSSYTSPNG